MHRIRFAMIGTQKCGTSTTLTAFRGHPQVFMDDVELFHDKIPEGNLQRFQDRLLAKAGPKPIVGPMHPDFVFFRSGAPMKACFGPDLKLIMTVRDPVKRAISNYWMEMNRDYFEKLPMPTALQDPTRNYLRRGHYHRQLIQFMKHFPREQLLIVRLEDMAEDTNAVLNTMLRWIGADPFAHRQEHVRQRIGHYQSEPPASVISYLAEHYAESNQQLHDEFGVKIDDWTS